MVTRVCTGKRKGKLGKGDFMDLLYKTGIRFDIREMPEVTSIRFGKRLLEMGFATTSKNASFPLKSDDIVSKL